MLPAVVKTTAILESGSPLPDDQKELKSNSHLSRAGCLGRSLPVSTNSSNWQSNGFSGRFLSTMAAMAPTSGHAAQPNFIIAQTPDGKWREPVPSPGSPLLPGSLNPLHAGHLEMARIAAETCGRACWFEISLANVDKAGLTPDDLVDPLRQNFAEHGVIVTNARSSVKNPNSSPDPYLR